MEQAEKGIIYIDEIDKITRKSETPSSTRDVSGELEFESEALNVIVDKANERKTGARGLHTIEESQ